MPATARAAVFVGSGQPLQIREYPVPEPEPGAALVQITLANVCGSDLHLWRGELDPVKRGRAVPIHQGHEGTGRIVALGEGLTTDSPSRSPARSRPHVTWAMAQLTPATSASGRSSGTLNAMWLG